MTTLTYKHFKKGILPVLIVASFLAVAVSVYAQTQAKTPEQLESDIRYLRNFMREYEIWLDQAAASGYEAWGFTIDQTGLANLNGIIKDAQTALFHKHYDEAVRLLERWEDEFKRYDDAVTQQLLDVDFRYLEKFLIAKQVPTVDDWLKQTKEAGYQIDGFIAEWGKLKAELFQIRDNWKSNPAKSQLALIDWERKYFNWEERFEAKINALDKDAFEAWKKQLHEWLQLADEYFSAEGADIAAAAKDELPGAQEDLAFLESKRSLLEKARQALEADELGEAEEALNQLDQELFQYSSQLALEFREWLDSTEHDFNAWLGEVRARIDNLSEKGIDVSALNQEFENTENALAEAKAAADRHCSTYMECGENLNEYDGYWAAAQYTEIETWKEWWEETLHGYETEGVEPPIGEPEEFLQRPPPRPNR